MFTAFESVFVVQECLCCWCNPEGSHTLQPCFPPGSAGSPRPGGSALPPAPPFLSHPPGGRASTAWGAGEGVSAGAGNTLKAKGGLEVERREMEGHLMNVWALGFEANVCGSKLGAHGLPAAPREDVDRKRAADTEQRSPRSVPHRMCACRELHSARLQEQGPQGPGRSNPGHPKKRRQGSVPFDTFRTRSLAQRCDCFPIFTLSPSPPRPPTRNFSIVL